MARNNLRGEILKRIITAILAFVFVFSPIATAMANGKTPIVAKPTTTVEQMQEWAKNRGADPDFIKEAKRFYDISLKYGIDPAVTYAQSAKETNFFKFTGVVPKEFNNPCGLKIRAGGANEDKNAHMKFEDWQEGITAHVHHLALYAGHPDFPYSDENTPDPRHFPSIYAKAKFVEDLGGRWAPSKKYGWETAIMMYDLCKTTVNGVDPIPGPDKKPEIPKELLEPPKPAPQKPEPQKPVVPVEPEKPVEVEKPKEPIEDPSLSIGKVEPVVPEKNIQRIFGDSRITTAIQASNQLSDKSDQVIIASAMEFADALVSSSLVAKDQKIMPILLNSGNRLNSDLSRELTRLGAKEAIIVGGVNHIPVGVENDLRNLNIECTRIAGNNRYETANLISDINGNKEKYILANGNIFADALSISSYAALNDISILLTNGKSLDAATSAKLESAKEVIIIGGVNSVSGPIGDNLKSKGVAVTRISGANRYATSVEIAKSLYPKNKVFITANGRKFPDSLVGAPLAAKYSAPILLTEGDKLSPIVESYLKSAKPTNILVLGGNVSMSTDVYRSLNSIVK
ncbi:MAG: cell wall-binding repeat-containing protein [Tissierellia bacterium]|nr:cell wall-binding repeat-containing protein [Tissierellia bacterium]